MDKKKEIKRKEPLKNLANHFPLNDDRIGKRRNWGSEDHKDKSPRTK